MENVNEKVTGPLLTDSEFFAELDRDIPALCEASRLFEGGDVSGAYAAFHSYIKSIIDPDKYYSMPGRERVPEASENLIKEADTVLSHYITVLGTPYQFGKVIDWEYNATPNGYKEWTWHLSYTQELSPLSRAYRATGDEKYACEIVDMLLSWIRQAVHPDFYTTSAYDTKTWRTIEAGKRMVFWAEAIYSIAESPAFTPEAWVTIFKSIFEHGMRLTNRYTHGNWLFYELGGVSTICMIFPVFAKCRAWAEDINARLAKALNTQIHPDGSQYELAPGYHLGILSTVSTIANVAYAFGFDLTPVYKEKIMASVDYFIRMRMADGYIPPINDSQKLPLKRAVSFARRFFPEDVVEFFSSNGFTDAYRPDFNSTVIPYAGFVTFRTGWGKDDISAFFDAGKFGRDHHHEDKLNLLVYNSEKPVIYEAGTYAYDSSAMRKYATSTEGHNTVKINGNGQNRRCTHVWADPEVQVTEPVAFYSDDRLDYAKGVYDKDYGIDEPKSLAIHQRQVVFLKKPAYGRALVVAVDTMKSGDANTYEALWHLNTEGDVRVEDGRITCDEATLFTCGFDRIETVKGYFTEEKCKGYICTGTDLGNYYEAPQLCCFRDGDNVEFATLIALGGRDDIAVSGFEYKEGVVTIGYKNGDEDVINLTELCEASKIF